jgi:hypothetical protein
MLKLYLRKTKFKNLKIVISNLRLGGISSIMNREHLYERHLVRKRNFTFSIIDRYYYFERAKFTIINKMPIGIYNFLRSLKRKIK